MSEPSVVYATSNNGTAVMEPVPQVEERQSKLYVSPDRMDDIKVATWRKVEDGKVAGMADLVGMFLHDGTAYLTKEEAQIETDSYSTRELKEITKQLTEAMKKAVASPQ